MASLAASLAEMAAASAAQHAMALANMEAEITKKGDEDAQQILG